MDPWADGDEITGKQWYADLVITGIQCDHDGCWGGESGWESPSSVQGYGDAVSADIKAYAEAEWIEALEPNPVPVVPAPERGRPATYAPPSSEPMALEPSGPAELSFRGDRARPADPTPSSRLAPSRPEITIRDARSGAVVPGARLHWVEDSFDGFVVKNARADSSGRVLLESLSTVRHEVVASAPGYGQARGLVASGGATPVRTVILLDMGAVISGTVSTGAGAPLGGATVSIVESPLPPLLEDTNGRVVSTGWHGDILTTDPERGTFEAMDVQPNIGVMLRISHPEHRSILVGPFVLSPGERRSNVNVTMQR